jgi:hypothetical protein
VIGDGRQAFGTQHSPALDQPCLGGVLERHDGGV